MKRFMCILISIISCIILIACENSSDHTGEAKTPSGSSVMNGRDYQSVVEEFEENGEYSESKYNDYRLEQLKNAKEKVKYTVDFTLTKVDGQWIVDDLSNEIRDKINGMYVK